MVKEYVKIGKGQYRYCLKLENYGKSLDVIDSLWNQAVKDFPDLSKNEVELIHYSNPKYYGIEFTISVKPPKSYAEAVHLSHILQEG